MRPADRSAGTSRPPAAPARRAQPERPAPIAPSAVEPSAVEPSAVEPSAVASSEGRGAVRHQRIALVDLLDRVLARGVVITGDVTLSIADVDLVTISLRALVSSVRDADAVPGLTEKGANR